MLNKRLESVEERIKIVNKSNALNMLKYGGFRNRCVSFCWNLQEIIKTNSVREKPKKSTQAPADF